MYVPVSDARVVSVRVARFRESFSEAFVWSVTALCPLSLGLWVWYDGVEGGLLAPILILGAIVVLAAVSACLLPLLRSMTVEPNQLVMGGVLARTAVSWREIRTARIARIAGIPVLRLQFADGRSRRLRLAVGDVSRFAAIIELHAGTEHPLAIALRRAA